MLGSKPSFRKSTFFNLKVPEKKPKKTMKYIYILQIPVLLFADKKNNNSKNTPCFFLHVTHFFIFEFAIPFNINLNC